MLVEQVQQTPDPHPAAVLKERLVVQVPLPQGDRRWHLVVSLVMVIAIQERVFRAFLVVHHHRHRDFGVVGPTNLRRVFTVTDKVALQLGHLVEQLDSAV